MYVYQNWRVSLSMLNPHNGFRPGRYIKIRRCGASATEKPIASIHDEKERILFTEGREQEWMKSRTYCPWTTQWRSSCKSRKYIMADSLKVEAYLEFLKETIKTANIRNTVSCNYCSISNLAWIPCLKSIPLFNIIIVSCSLKEIMFV